jgi:hypothetical protein
MSTHLLRGDLGATLRPIGRPGPDHVNPCLLAGGLHSSCTIRPRIINH